MSRIPLRDVDNNLQSEDRDRYSNTCSFVSVRRGRDDGDCLLRELRQEALSEKAEPELYVRVA